ncbi:hypothetical protein ACI2L1_28715 [Streptomyces sp. NPDC019531]|uniref:hypothetical protein n=1 Tax=Streptomyces sp. NPDC019531 TaxID=3365062 RepID=UPI0038512DC6
MPARRRTRGLDQIAARLAADDHTTLAITLRTMATLSLPKNSSVLVGAGVRVVSSAGARAGALGTW